MLFGNTEKNPRIMIKLGMFFLLVFFSMNLLPHPTSTLGDGIFDGLRGVLLGAGGSLVLWATYLNGHRRRAGKN